MTWEPVAGPGVREAQAAIESLLGFTEETFLASSLALQGSLSFADPRISRVQRCDLLMDGLGLTEYEEMEKLAARDRRKAEATVARLADRIAQDAQELADKDRVGYSLSCVKRDVQLADADLCRAQQNLDILLDQQRQAEQRVSERRAAQAEHDQAEQERQRLREKAAAADAARGSIRVAQERLAALADAEDVATLEAAYEEALLHWQQVADERERLTTKIVHLRDDQACPECKRPYDNAEQTEREIRLAETTIRNLPQVEPPDISRLQHAREQQTERARLEERIQGWQAVVAEVEDMTFVYFDDANHKLARFIPRLIDEIKAEDDYADAKARLDALPPLDQAEITRIHQATLTARAQVNEQRARLDQAREDKARLQERLDRLTQLQARHDADTHEHAQARHAHARAAAMEQMYGRDGIPALVIENIAAPYLEQEASRILAELGLRWQLQVRMGKETLKGVLKPALDVVVVKENGVEQPYALASGGEDTRIGRALQIAFARLFKQRRGAHSELFALDEPPYLDQAGLTAFLGLLNELTREFMVVQVVSHDSGLRDSVDEVVQVVREDGRSRIAEHAAADYAPAATVAA